MTARLAATLLAGLALCGLASTARAERTLSAHPLDLVRIGDEVRLLVEVRHIDRPPEEPSGLSPRDCPGGDTPVDGCYRLRVFQDSRDLGAVPYRLLGGAGNRDVLLASYRLPAPRDGDALIDLDVEIDGFSNGNAGEHFPIPNLPGVLHAEMPFAFLQARSDDALNAAYRRLRLQLGPGRRDEAAALQAAQRDWLAASRKACGDPAGLEDDAAEDWSRCQWQRDVARLQWLRTRAVALGIAQRR
ncbi:DUF1311 domain-containing protein [Luteimonas sp. BDR2-5]|uniref:lysozyme inhibitor LprI family protein n=1 Tax=Proluteimonas luteida TaxID=2878685 RepID=UPI001E54C05E|nr:lysozyme inhibitor LprI family protein [Luteimonas sp. BDR2-5]MCD9028779.1 DUF1311 domain-containing protein [Luteimonas sp. BDR2-5]